MPVTLLSAFSAALPTGVRAAVGLPAGEAPPLPVPGTLVRGLEDDVPRLGELPATVAHAVRALASNPWMLLPLGAALLTGVTVLRVARRWQARHLGAGGRLITVALPPQVEPAAAQAFWTNMSALLRPVWKRRLFGQPHLSWELTATLDTGIDIHLWVPQTVPPGLVERALEAAWPGARTTVTTLARRNRSDHHSPATAPATPSPTRVTGAALVARPETGRCADGGLPGLLAGTVGVTAGRLRLARPQAYPLRTEHPHDPLRPLLAALTELPAGYTAGVQLLVRPASARHTRALTQAARVRRAGRHPCTRAWTAPHFLAAARSLVGSPTPSSSEVDPTRARDVTVILSKAAEPCFQVSLRYLVTAPERSAGERLPRQVRERERAVSRGRAHALASAFAAYTDRNALTRSRLPHPAAVLRGRRFDQRPDLLGVSELAALAHLPTDEVLPGLTRAGARSVPASPLIPTRGKVLGDSEASNRDTSNRDTSHRDTSTGSNPTADPITLGTPRRAAGRPVAVSPVDARQHLHIMGATGSGKSTLLTNLILGDIDAGRGVVVIDPKGDLVTDILDRLPARAVTRTVVLDPAETTAPPALNVLAGTDPDLVVDNLVGIFRSIYAAFWGPRTDDILRSACLTLIRHATRITSSPGGAGDATAGARRREACLAEVPRLLTDPTFRTQATLGLGDPSGLGGFWNWYDGMGDAARAQAIGPLLNKLRAFLLRDSVRRLVGTPSSTFSMGEVLDGGVCLVRIPKGTLGEDTSRLLGSFVVAQVWQAATHRAALGEAARVDAALYVDECQNFLTLPRSFDDMLAEARGYHLSLVLAHQHLGQLPRDLRDTIAANARTKVWFTLSPEDARPSARHTLPELSEHDLAHLPAYTAAARLLVAGTPAPACTVATRPAPPVIPGRAEATREACRHRYGLTATPTDHRPPAPSPADSPTTPNLVFPPG